MADIENIFFFQFGAGSSPGCSNFALKRTAEDGEREFGARATETLRKHFDRSKTVGF